MVKVRILRDTVAGGCDVHAGEVVEVSDSDAAVLVAIKKAARLTDSPVVEGHPRTIKAPRRR